MSANEEGLSLIHDIRLPYKLTYVASGLMFLSSIGGLLFGPRGWYDPTDSTFPALLSQDVITLTLILPLMLFSATLARNGSLRGLLCWMGALFYNSYFYYFNVVGVQFNPLFPVYIGIVSVNMYTLLALLFGLDPEQIKNRFNELMPRRTIALFLMGISLAFAGIWTGLIASHIAAGRELTTVTRLVIAVDGVVLLPLSFFAGLWLWRKAPLGYVLASLLLVDVAATFLTLTATACLAAMWGQVMDPLVPLYVAMMFGSIFLLVRSLESIQTERFFDGKEVGRTELAARWNTLPEPVRRYLRYAIKEDAPPVRRVQLKHGGAFRMSPTQRWLTVKGDQYFSVADPGFIWRATVQPWRFISIQARDSLIHGRGNMLVKVMCLLTIVNARGPHIDQGARLRWLAECAWFPYAFVGDSIEWSPIDERSARATLKCDGLPVTAVFEFDEEGKLCRLHAERYRDMGRGKEAALTPWSGEYSNYREFGGFRVPTTVDVSWKLERGSFSYARFDVTALVTG